MADQSLTDFLDTVDHRRLAKPVGVVCAYYGYRPALRPMGAADGVGCPPGRAAEPAVWVDAEATATVTPGALRSFDALRRRTEVPTAAVAAGGASPDEVRAAADRLGVECLPGPELAAPLGSTGLELHLSDTAGGGNVDLGEVTRWANGSLVEKGRNRRLVHLPNSRD